MPHFFAFFWYIFIMAFTPGPNNIISMSNAIQHGFIRGLRLNIGIFLGFVCVMSCCAAFCSTLFALIPKVEFVMSMIGAAYILWLAIAIYLDKPHAEKKRRTALQTNSIVTGMILQFVNVKCILYGITAMSTFILPYYKSLPAIALFILILSLMGFVCTCFWSLFGSVFQAFFKSHQKALNIIMALLLVYCAVSIVLPYVSFFTP